MKNIITILLVAILLSACQNSTKTSASTAEVESKTDLNRFPEALQKVFAKHGGLERWNNMNALSYEIEKEEGNEKQFVDLKNRRERIEAPTFKTGYDGKDFWLEADTSYKGNPVFYHNLMFYFYAMPFVVADPGINFKEVEPIEYEEKKYPGILISYDDGIGVSPEDEYYIYYDSETYEMAWLAYTVTYFSKEKGGKLGWIRYNDWKDFNGLLLPNSVNWFKKTESGSGPIEPRNTRSFANVKIQEEPFGKEVFEKTAEAEIVKE